jgi:HEAT repeat protein
MTEVGKVWSFNPGKPLIAKEENALASWKDSFTAPVVHRLGDRDPRSRAAAIACLGRLPFDSDAAPAVAYLEDSSSPEVRKQVLVSFAQRPAVLSNEAVLKHVYDNEAGIPEVANLILKTRGLTQEQISLGSMIYHPKPEIRASVITLIKDRTDIDPAVWLLQLSHDTEESVRLGAAEALAARLTPEVRHRLAEMAAGDSSQAVRTAAGKYLPQTEKTAGLPPLPGSPSLNPKAN